MIVAVQRSIGLPSSAERYIASIRSTGFLPSVTSMSGFVPVLTARIMSAICLVCPSREMAVGVEAELITAGCSTMSSWLPAKISNRVMEFSS